MAVFTFCPPSGLGDIIVIMPSEEIFRNPFISDSSAGRVVRSVFKEANDGPQPKLSINPPLASADDLRKFRLLIEVFDPAIIVLFGVFKFWSDLCLKI
jgi:hypothetical protein